MTHAPATTGPVPQIVTELPGPKAKALLARDKQYISSSYTRGYPFVMESGEGMMARDVDGNVFLDFAAGIAVNATGHRHPRVMAAIKDQLENRFWHMSGTDFYYPSQIELAERLALKSKKSRDMRVFFCNSGAEAVEGALKLAKWKTGRTDFVAMTGAFHGRTMGALSVGSSKAIHRQRFSPFLPGVHHMPYPDTYRGLKAGQTPEQLADECLAHLKNVIFKRMVEPTQVAGIIVEPVQGEGGYIVPPKNFLPGLRAICDEFGIMMILDEVQAGGGRTGKFWGHDHFGIEPDIIAWAKGIASGLPLGVVIAPADIMCWPPGTHASTFGGNPLACRAAIATLELLDEGLTDNAAKMGEKLRAMLRTEVGELACVGDVRGLGLMIAIDMVKDKTSKTPDGAIRGKIEMECFRRGLLVIGCGESSIRMCPSLIVNEAECKVAVRIFGAAIRAALAA